MILAAFGPWLAVCVHTLVIYLFLIAAFRFVGRRQLAQLTVIDFVVLIVLGSAVETAMIAGNTSLAAGIISAGTLLGVNRLLTRVCLRSRRWRHLVVGGPVLLVNNGHILEEHVRRAGLTEADVLEAIRERGQDRLDAVKFAVLEPGGSINVVPMDAPTHRSEVGGPREPRESDTQPGRHSPS